MTLSKKQLDYAFTTTLVLSFVIALTLALLIVQLRAQVANTLDNLVLASMRPTRSLPQTAIPFGIISGSSPADDILIEWKAKHGAMTSAIAESTAKIINFPETIAPQDLDLTDFSLKELKQLAKLRGVGYTKMTKAQLLIALQ